MAETSRLSSIRHGDRCLLDEERTIIRSETKVNPETKVCRIKISEIFPANEPKEIRVELSSPADEDFIFGCSVSRVTFPSLVEKNKLTMGFENFAQRLVDKVKRPPMADSSSPTLFFELSPDKRSCTLQTNESYSRQDLLTLSALEGDELVRYLKNQLSDSRRAARSLQSQRSARLQAEEQLAMLKEQLANLEETLTSERLARQEEKEKAEDNAEMAREYRMDIDRLRDVEEELSEQQKECDELREMLLNESDSRKEEEKRSHEAKNRMESDHRKELKILKDDWKLREMELEEMIRDEQEESKRLTRQLREMKAKEQSRGAMLRDNFLATKPLEEDPVRSFEKNKMVELEKDLSDKNAIIARLNQLLEAHAMREADLAARLQQAEETILFQSARNNRLSRDDNVAANAVPTPQSAIAPLYRSPLLQRQDNSQLAFPYLRNPRDFVLGSAVGSPNPLSYTRKK